MTLRFTPFLTAALLALGVASAPAQAQEQDQGWFVGAGGGISKYKSGCTVLPGGTTCDDNGAYLKVFGGYQFNPYFGFELGYADFGKLKTSSAASTATLEATGIEISIVATMPLNREFSLYAKYGLYRWDADLKITGTGATTVDTRGNESTYGFGANYNLTRNVALRMEYQKYFDVGDALTGTFDVEAGLLGIVFKF
ncbi:MAG TPA: outer membrane beta-barrel protein [Burkholderiales bacterium]|jgi:OOP family OmpA-OmpF porin